MNICGLLVHPAPHRIGTVCENLSLMPGVEIHQETADGRLIVTVEDTTDRTAGDTVLAIHRLEGVLAASISFHFFDTDASPAQSDAGETADEHLKA